MVEKATKTIQTRLHIASGDRSWLHDARLASRELFNHTIRLKQHGYTRTEYNERLTATTFYGTTSARSSAKLSKRGTLTNHSLTGGTNKMTLVAASRHRRVRTMLVRTRS